MKRTIIAVLALSVALGQPKPVYEVASIRANPSVTASMQIRSFSPRLSIANVTLRQLILLAYGPPRTRGGALAEIPIEGGPAWIGESRFDVEAQPESGITPAPEQSQQMLQSLLADRFQLRIRKEARSGPVYVLTVARGVSKLRAASAARSMNLDTGAIHATNQPVSRLVDVLSGQVGRKVVDRTGLTGSYDLDLAWTQDLQADGGPSVFTALQEQLGLRLEAATEPVETLVIEHVEKPSAN